MASNSTQPPLPANINESNTSGLLAVFITFVALAWIAGVMRIASRRVARLPLWWDDYLIIACLPLTIVQLVFLIEAIHNGMGKHLLSFPPETIEQILPNYLMWTYASEIWYPFVITIIKSSILLLYIRLFRVQVVFRRVCYGLLVFVVLWAIAVLFSTIFQCNPISGAWIKTIPAQCIDLRSWLLGTNVPNILVDVVIICAPMKLIWDLKLSWPRRLSLIGIFCLAFATTIISCLRVNANANIDVTDPTWSFAPIAEFSTIEGCVGIMCACLPTLAPLFRVFAGKRAFTVAGSKQSSGNQSSGISSRQLGARYTHDQSFTQLEDDEAKDLVSHPNHKYSGYASQGNSLRTQTSVPMDTINVRNDIYVSSSGGR